MSTGPPPSQLCLLSALPLREVGEKVRFLGCVSSYSSDPAAVLTLEHRAPGDQVAVHALVDVALVLERLSRENIRRGEWVNVIGYITSIGAPADGKGEEDTDTRVGIRALMLWPAGNVDVRLYELSLGALHGK